MFTSWKTREWKLQLGEICTLNSVWAWFYNDLKILKKVTFSHQDWFDLVGFDFSASDLDSYAAREMKYGSARPRRIILKT